MSIVFNRVSIVAQQGISLIESIVSILVFAIGILGVVSVQSLGLKVSVNSDNMNIAVNEASNMADIMLSNPQAVIGGSFNSVSSTAVDSTCTSNCTPSDMAQADIYDWQQNLSSQLPNATGTIVSNGTSGLFTIVISWNERGKDSDETKQHSLTFIPYQP